MKPWQLPKQEAKPGHSARVVSICRKHGVSLAQARFDQLDGWAGDYELFRAWASLWGGRGPMAVETDESLRNRCRAVIAGKAMPPITFSYWTRWARVAWRLWMKVRP